MQQKIERKAHLHEAGDNKDNTTQVEELNYLKEKQINASALIVCWSSAQKKGIAAHLVQQLHAPWYIMCRCLLLKH